MGFDLVVDCGKGPRRAQIVRIEKADMGAFDMLQSAIACRRQAIVRLAQERDAGIV